MSLLLDTHIFLWYITNDAKLSMKAQTAIRDPGNDVYLSAASIWEAVIKFQLGKLPLPHKPDDYLSQQRIAHSILALPIEEGAMPLLASLPPLHRDPFDRMLVAQALQHGLTLVTQDPLLLAYPVASL